MPDPRPHGPPAGHQGDLGRWVNNDAVAAKTLAQLLRTNLLAEAWIAPPDARQARRLVRMRSRIQSQLHALLADLGIIPELTTLFGPAGRRWLAELQLPAAERGRLAAGLRLLDAVTVEVGRADADPQASFAGDGRCGGCCRSQGSGWYPRPPWSPRSGTSAAFPVRSGCAPGPGSLLGSRPATPTPAAATPAKQGSRWLRWVPAEAATTTAVRNPQLGRFAGQIAQRRGVKIARVALARRLLTLCYSALRDEGAAVPTRPRPPSRPDPGALGVCHGRAGQRPPT
jgi:transposase